LQKSNPGESRNSKLLSVCSLRLQVSDCISFVVPLMISVLNMSFFNKEFKTEDFPTPDLPYAPILIFFSLKKILRKVNFIFLIKSLEK